MEDGQMIANEGLVEIMPGGIVSLPESLTTATNISDDALSGQRFIILTSEDGKVTGFQALQQNMQTADQDINEPGAKRIRVQPDEDGPTFFVALSGGDEAAITQGGLVADQSIKIEQQLTSETDTSLSSELVQEPKSNVVSQEWFTTKDDKNALQNQGHSWKQGQWSREEIEVLQNNINKYCEERNITDPTEIIFEKSKDERKDFYRTIARGLQRPLFSVYRRVVRMYDQCNHIGKYSQEELAKLQELRIKHGPDWATIGAALGRSASSVKDRCRLMKDTCNSGKWLPDEERRLSSAVYELAGCKPDFCPDNEISGELDTTIQNLCIKLKKMALAVPIAQILTKI